MTIPYSTRPADSGGVQSKIEKNDTKVQSIDSGSGYIIHQVDGVEQVRISVANGLDLVTSKLSVAGASGTSGDILTTNGTTVSWAAPVASVSDKIEEGNSKIEVVDSGNGYIIHEVDGVETTRTTNGKFGIMRTPVTDAFECEGNSRFTRNSGNTNLKIENNSSGGQANLLLQAGGSLFTGGENAQIKFGDYHRNTAGRIVYDNTFTSGSGHEADSLKFMAHDGNNNSVIKVQFPMKNAMGENGAIKLFEPNGTWSVGLSCKTSQASNDMYELPDSIPLTDMYLKCDPQGSLSWDTPLGGGGSLSALTDTNITGPADGDGLYYNSNNSMWENGTQKILQHQLRNQSSGSSVNLVYGDKPLQIINHTGGSGVVSVTLPSYVLGNFPAGTYFEIKYVNRSYNGVSWRVEVNSQTALGESIEGSQNSVWLYSRGRDVNGGGGACLIFMYDGTDWVIVGNYNQFTLP